MSKRMIAVFSDDAYKAIQNGEAVFNNGFRKTRGAFFPDQPDFLPFNTRADMTKNALINIGIRTIEAGAFYIVLPAAKRFVDEKVLPAAAEKWDELMEKKKSKKEKDSEESKSKIIEIRDIRREA